MATGHPVLEGDHDAAAASCQIPGWSLSTGAAGG